MRIAAFGAAFLAAATPAFAYEPEVAVREAVMAYAENFNAGSVEGVASTFASRDGFRLVENGRIVFTDKAAAVAALRQSSSPGPRPRMEFSSGITVTVINPGSAAAAVAPFGLYVADGGGVERKVFDGAITMTLVMEDGLWRILVMHTSSTGGAD